jgi:hypothetical protein
MSGVQVVPRDQPGGHGQQRHRPVGHPAGIVDRGRGPGGGHEVVDAADQRLRVGDGGEAHPPIGEERREIGRVERRDEERGIGPAREQRPGCVPAAERQNGVRPWPEAGHRGKARGFGPGAAALNPASETEAVPVGRRARLVERAAVADQHRLRDGSGERLDTRAPAHRHAALHDRRIHRARGEKRGVLGRALGLADLEGQAVAGESQGVTLGNGVIGAARAARGEA